jgi:hypothetical protein
VSCAGLWVYVWVVEVEEGERGRRVEEGWNI